MGRQSRTVHHADSAAFLAAATRSCRCRVCAALLGERRALGERLQACSGFSSRATHSVTGPSPMRKLSAGANRRTCQSLLSKASESDAYHSSSRRLMLESAAFTLAMSARATSTLLESASWPSHPPAWPTDLRLRNLHRACGFTFNAVGKASHRFEGFEKLRPKT